MNIDLEDILLKTHNISWVRGAECDYEAEIQCTCNWEGSPYEYNLHILLTLGFEKVLLDNWVQRSYLGSSEYIDERAKEQYLNLYRGPEDRKTLGLSKKEWGALSKTERKESKKAGKLVRKGSFAEDPKQNKKWDYLFEEPSEF